MKATSMTFTLVFAALAAVAGAQAEVRKDTGLDNPTPKSPAMFVQLDESTGKTRPFVDRDGTSYGSVRLNKAGRLRLGEGKVSAFGLPELLHNDRSGTPIASPGSGSVSTQNVYGPDNRVQIFNTEDFPWSTQCKLRITWPDGSIGGGSGTLIDNQWVLTAGHCMYKSAKGGWATKIEVYPGRDAGYLPFTTQTVFRSGMTSVNHWVQDANFDYDLGLLELPSDPGATGWLGFAAYTDNEGKTGNLAGYPGDKATNTMWFDSDPIDAQTTRRLYYFIDAFNGQSGSGVYRLIDGARYIVGVHSGSNVHSSVEKNRATRITDEMFDLILGVID